MRRARLVFLSVATLGVTAAGVACTTDYQKGVDDPNFGAPNALAGQRQPGSSTDTVIPAEGSSSSGGSTILCVASGGTLLADAGPCSVSFKDDVLPALGLSTCAQTSCHGGLTPPTPPRIEPSDPAAMWAEFANFKMNSGQPYINPCSKDKTQAGLACNLADVGTCGVKMPLGGTFDQAQVAKIETWLECGSPNN